MADNWIQSVDKEMKRKVQTIFLFIFKPVFLLEKYNFLAIGLKASTIGDF